MRRTTMIAALLGHVRSHLRAAADPAKARAMAAYMKTTMPFYGVQKPERTRIAKSLRSAFAPADLDQYLRAVSALWSEPHRESKYLAITYARTFKEHIAPASMPLYEMLIVEGGWWDFVDEVAVHLVGTVVRKHRATTFAVLDRWIEDPNFWLRRSAIIAQLTLKQSSDERRLYRYCLQQGQEREFFIRKAIGWALREHGKCAPDSVARFIRAHRSSLAPLSIREATRKLPGYAWPPSS